MKKKRGSIDDLIIPVISILFVFVIVVSIVYWGGALSKKEDIQQVLRKYSLKMECDGYLTTANASNLKKELEDLGVKNVDLNGTTFNKQDFGSTIYLKCTYTQPTNKVNISGFNFTTTTEDIRSTKQISTCAKN